MKRARKGKAKNNRSERMEELKSTSSNYSVDDKIFEVNEEEDKDFQLKYFGKIIEDTKAEESDELTSDTFSDEPTKSDTVPIPEVIESPETAEDKALEEQSDELNFIDDEALESEEAVGEEEKAEDEPIISEQSEDIPLTDSEKSDLSKNKKKKSSVKKRAVIFSVSLIVILLASVLALCMGGMFGSRLGNDGDDEYIEPVDELTGKVNVLILGVDNEGLRTDTMIVASFDTDENTVNMLSIPRDTRMYVGSKYQKINAAHAISKKGGKIAGPDGSIEAVTRLTGIPINYYVEFSFKAFRDTIDALDGIYYNVPQNMNYDDPTQDLHIHLKEGYQLLDGDKSEQLVRFRSYREGDIKRVGVQQEFIKAVADQKLNASIVAKVPELYKVLSSNVKTNLKIGDITKYANALLNLNLENMITYQLPGDYSGDEYKASYWLCNMNETRKLVETVFGYDTTYTTIDKPINGAVYGKTADPSKDWNTVSTIEPSRDIPEETVRITTPDGSKKTSKPKNTTSSSPSKTTAGTEKPKKTTAPTKSVSPTKAPTKTSSSEPTHSAAPVTTPPAERNTPTPTPVQKTSTPAPTTKAPSTPPPQTSAPSENNGDSGFVRPKPN